MGVCAKDITDFSIHALLAESDRRSLRTTRRFPFFYPRSPCGERRHISALAGACLLFYPRSPCGERRIMFEAMTKSENFLSTLSLRRATRFGRPIDVQLIFSIHALLAESDILVFCGPQGSGFSIHALLAESDARPLSTL